MTDRPDPLDELRDELGEQFLRVARDEPRSRLRRRLRYAGITLVCGLLAVPAAVAISGASDDRDDRDRAATRAACAPAALAAPSLSELRPYARELSVPRKRELRAIDKDARTIRKLAERAEAETCAMAPSLLELTRDRRAPGLSRSRQLGAALRSDCLVIRTMHGKGGRLEVTRCPEAIAVRPARRPGARRP